MSNPTIQLYKIASSIAEIPFKRNGLCSFEVAGKNITLAKKSGRLFAFADKCPHAGTQLSAGYLDAKNCIVCPLHGYRYSLTHGHNVSGEGYKLKTYKTHKQPDGWYVEI